MPWILSKAKSDRRLYVDLLFRKTKMYANFTPETFLKLGDYGDISRDGDLILLGNIFKDAPHLKDEVELYSESFGSPRHFFVSRSRKKTFSTITTEIPILAECSPKHRWETTKDRHAALVMIDSNRSEMKFEGRLHRYIQGIPELADKAFVTKAYKCSAYARLVTESGQSGEIHVGFKGHSNRGSPSATNIDTPPVGIDVDQSWQTFSQAGDWTTGISPAERVYTPLVTLRQIMPKDPSNGFRDPLPPKINDEDEMKDYILPWGDLDEEGVEIDED